MKQKFYDTCQECRYARFVDFETMNCLKLVEYEPNTICGEYEIMEAGKRKESNLLAVADEIDEILAVEDEQIIEKLKKRPAPEVVAIKKESPEINAPGPEIFSVHTKKEINIYSDPKTRSEHIIRTEPANKLIPFYRRVIRGGEDLIMLKADNGEKTYLKDDRRDIVVTVLARTKENPMDIILMSHQDFDQSVSDTKYKSGILKESLSEHMTSRVVSEGGVTSAVIKDDFIKEGKNISSLNELKFNKALSNVKIGRLEAYTNFYILDDTKTADHARKIKLTDETEAILINKDVAYEIIEMPLQALVTTISQVLFVVVVILGIGLFFIETGWVVFAGILMIPLAFIIMLFFSLPLYYILSQIVKLF